MNLAETVRMMAEKKGTPPWDSGKQDYAGAAKELKDYAMKSGGIDKKDMLSVANQLASLAKQKSPSVGAKMMRNVQGLDTDVREKIQSILKKHGLTESVMESWLAEAPEDNEPASPDEGSMAKQQLEFIEYAAEEIEEHIDKGGKFPEWMQNKLATVHDNMQSLHAQIDHDMIDDDEPEEMDEAVNMDRVRRTYNGIMKGGRQGPPDDDEVGDYIGKGMTKADIAALIKMLAKQGYDAKFLTKDLAPLAELSPATHKRYQDAAFKDAARGMAQKRMGTRSSQSAYDKERKRYKGIDTSKYLNRKQHGVKEEVEEARDPSKSGGSGYDLYHKDFSSAMKHAYDYAKKKYGIEIDPQEIDDKVASGPRKPSSGKTNTYRLKGKDGKKAVQIQVSNLDNKKYELNMYKESVEMELDENAGLIKDYQGMKAQGKKDSNILDALMSMPKYKRMSKDQMAKIIGDAKRKGIFKEDVELDEAMRVLATKGKTKVVTKGDGVARVMVGNKEIASGDLDDGAGGWFMSKKGEKGQKFFDSPKKIADFYAEEVEMNEEQANELFESVFEEEKLSLEDTLQAIWLGEAPKKKLDPVGKEDGDIDNDGDEDESDEYLAKKRKAIGKAMKKDSNEAEKEQEKEVSDKEDEPKEKVGKSKKQTKVDVNPSIEEEKGEEMTSAEMEKRDEIMKSLEKKKDEFVKKYGDRAKEVMARTAIKMAKKHA